MFSKDNVTKQYHLNIFLSNDMIEQIKNIAKEEERTMTDQIRYILKEYCKSYKK